MKEIVESYFAHRSMVNHQLHLLIMSLYLNCFRNVTATTTTTMMTTTTTMMTTTTTMMMTMESVA